MKQISLLALGCAGLIASPASAQDQPTDHAAHAEHGAAPTAPPPEPTVDAMDDMAMEHTAMNHSRMDHPMPARAQWTAGSGTSRLPGAEGMMPGIMADTGGWNIMAHAATNLNYTSASGPRGSDMAYVTSMLMASATRDTEAMTFQFSAMMSAEPAMNARGYPNLFATGETAGGAPLVDRQHPHDLFMELSARADIKLGAGTTLFVYGGPVGEPALGPSAFVHRLSASLNPEPPISHHWLDSTHITYGVVTAGLSAPLWQLEASAFRGREPDENRWDIETPRLDSWSVRATLTPNPRWAVQASYGWIKAPEITHPGSNERRFTASAHYASGGGLTAMLGYSARRRSGETTLPAWLAEANWNFDLRNAVFGRIENVTNDELFPDHADPLHDQPFKVTKLQAGYARKVRLGRVGLALGASGAVFLTPAALGTVYGKTPVQGTLFLRFWLDR
ncbi:hypothetical protein H7F51_04330 [Novosphingobium flavum]|uniref:Porin n=1 Tax=Novosphingobium flavum TaxID=1778672 RepID=A0A7X1FPW1_9SPHN|nr:hypothetical protein [Novosphingobium flavum]MBC2664743.1 hypothetical protein [Novosphingobium flavum]